MRKEKLGLEEKRKAGLVPSRLRGKLTKKLPGCRYSGTTANFMEEAVFFPLDRIIH